MRLSFCYFKAIVFRLLVKEDDMARWFILSGMLLVAIGVLIQFAPWVFNWFGKLPGDIRIESGQSKVFIPITSMIIISIVLTILINLFRRW